MKHKLSDYVMSRIAEAGVRHVFGVPGGGAMHLNDSIGREARLTFVGNLHEQASAIAAEAYAKKTEQLGVALVTTGPGGTNAVTGVASAWLDSAPVLFVSGQVKRPDLKGASGVRQVGVQEVDIVSIVRSITKYAVTVMDPLSIRYHLDRALHLARTRRPGPVWIDIPLDVQAATIEAEALPPYDPSEDAAPAEGDLEHAAAETLRLLERAARPVLLIGQGARLAHAAPELIAFAERAGVPILLTWLALDLVPETHPLYAGRPGTLAPRGANFTLQNCDLLVSIGARIDNTVCGYARKNLARGATKIVVDIDARELAKMEPYVEVPVCADAGAFVRALRAQWGARPALPVEEWRARVAGWRERYPIVTAEHRQREGRVSVYAFSDALSDALPEGATFVNGSSGAGIEIFLHAFRPKRGQRVLLSTALGAMGFAIPMTIGACLAGERCPVVAVDGDGGFQFNVQELQTIRRLDLPIKIFVLDNEGYASIRTSQRGYFGRLMGADASSGLTLPELGRVAAAYDIPFVRIDDQRDLRTRLDAVLAAPGPAVINVAVLTEEDRLPRTTSRICADGSMESTPLEDLFPFLPRDEFRANMIVPPLDDSDGAA